MSVTEKVLACISRLRADSLFFKISERKRARERLRRENRGQQIGHFRVSRVLLDGESALSLL